MKRAIISIVASIGVCLILGMLSSKLQFDSRTAWYPSLIKSSLTPPAFVFPVVWTILYMLMGASLGILFVSKIKYKVLLISLGTGQLVLNMLWSLLFFGMRDPVSALIDLIAIDILVLYYVLISYSLNKIISWLFIPYLIWIAFATYLNAYIVYYNR